MLRLMIKFWPVLIPLIIYVGWFFWAKARARKQDVKGPAFFSGPWWWAVTLTLVIGIAMFVILGISEKPVQGNYEPAHMENGVLVPGKVTP